MENIRISAELFPEEEGVESNRGKISQAEEECLDNLREAAELHLEELGEKAIVRQVIRREVEVRIHA